MIKRLLGCVREYRKHTILAPAFVLFEVLMDILLPLMMAVLIDSGVAEGDMPAIVRMGLALLACAMLALFFGVMSGRFAAVASAGFAKNVRHDLFYKMQEFSFASIDKFSTSSLVTRLTTDVTNLQNAFQMSVRIAVRAPFMLVFSLIMAFSISPRLSLVFLAVLPVLGLGIAAIMSKAHPTFERAFKLYDKMNAVVQENLRGIRVVKSYVREEYEIQKFESASRDIYDAFTKAEKLVSLAMPMMMFSMFSCTLAISWMGGRMIVFGDITAGILIGLLSYSMHILISLMMVAMVFMMLVISKASAKRITEVLSEESALTGPEEPVTRVEDGSIRFEDVSFSYTGDEEKLALRDVTLSIESGQTVGILGGTGAAKSTLVQLIPRLYDVTKGRLLVGGADVRRYEPKALREDVAMVLQKNELFGGTVKENLRWGNRDAGDEELEWACRVAQADGFIREMPEGYDTYIEQGGANVSGGQKQRLCIARALLKRPKILIFDDSTSAVDTGTDALIRKAMSEELPGATKLIIAQRVASVERADKIVVLDEGKVSAVGTHAELLESSEIYREVYTSQQRGGNTDGAL